MRIVFDCLLVIITTLIAIRSVRLIAKYMSNSLADWTILLLYAFQSFPVILDLIIGIPEYNAWFSGFVSSMTNDNVCIIYDLYVINLNLALLIVSKKSQNIEIWNFSSNLMKTTSIPNCLLYIIILSPAIHVLLSGNLYAFVKYSSFSGRGLQENFTELNSVLIIIAIIALMIWYFRKESTVLRLMFLILFSFLIIWISGKRYTVVTILFSILYVNVLERRESLHKMNILAFFIVMGSVVILYSVYYITSIKVTADSNFESIYAALRIDFGRDDVVKFTIWKEYLKGEHILEYPLQTVISTIFMLVPRSLFPRKGYPHYRYLTASLYNTTIFDIPAGMTPSILEMMIANFHYLGMPICIIFLCWYCKMADKSTTSVKKYCYAMVMMGMLTQSLDAMIILFYMVLFFMMTSQIKFTFGKLNR